MQFHTRSTTQSRGRRAPDLDDQDPAMMLASAAFAMFPKDARENGVAARLLIEATNSGRLKLACSALVHELHARPVRKSPPVQTSATVKEIIKGNGGGLLWIGPGLILTRKVSVFSNKPYMLTNWKHSMFVVVSPNIKPVRPMKSGRVLVEPGTRTVIYDAQFDKDSVHRLARDYANGALPESPGQKFRKPAVRYNWHHLIGNYIEAAITGSLEKLVGPLTEYGAQSRLEKKISEAAVNMGESTARRKAKQLLEMNRKVKERD